MECHIMEAQSAVLDHVDTMGLYYVFCPVVRILLTDVCYLTSGC